MKNYIRFAYAILIALFLSSSVLHAQTGDRNYAPGVVYIKLKEGSAVSNKAAASKFKSRMTNQVLTANLQARSFESIWKQQFQKAYRQLKRKKPEINADTQIRKLKLIYQLTYSGSIPPPMLASKLERLDEVEYAEPKYLRRVQYTPNDPKKGDEFLQFHNFYKAWELTKGDSETVIGIVDTGIDFRHEDLDETIWVNQDEIPDNWIDSLDNDQNNRVSSAEILTYLRENDKDYNNDGSINLEDAVSNASPLVNNSDDDDNGYTDDLFGWDFWQSGYTSDTYKQDNNPIGDHSSHGTLTGGVAGAETDNNVGIAATGFNVSLMPIKTGGVKNNPDTPDVNESNLIGFGFNGILYAALNGADIINCSWGGGTFSEVEQQIIQTAFELGSLVIAAAGNSGTDDLIFPAGFNETLAVGSVETSGDLSSYSNFGYNLDVLATGTRINSTSRDNEYLRVTGTSISTPVVSGLAGLLKSQHPDWSPNHIATQIRVTSHRIDLSSDDSRKFKLGHGIVDAESALKTNKPGLRVLSTNFLNQRDQKLSMEEPGKIVLTLTNYGKKTDNITLSLRGLQSHLQTPDNSKNIGTINQHDTLQLTFDITIEEEFDLSSNPSFLLTMEDEGEGYSDFELLQYDNILYNVFAVNNVVTSFAADGTVGFTDPFLQKGGVGFRPRKKESDRYKIGPNFLFEGGLITAVSGQVADAVRTGSGGYSRDFIPQSTFRLINPRKSEPFKGQTQFSTEGGNTLLSNLEISLTTYGIQDSTVSNVVYAQYQLKNTTYENRLLKEVYVGLFNDWDLGTAFNNSVRYSEADNLLYVFDNNNFPYYVGLSPMGPLSSALAIDNGYQGTEDSLNINIYRDFTDQEKLDALVAGTRNTRATGTDVSTVVASGPYDIGPRSHVTAGFIFAYGRTLTELRNQISSARRKNPFNTSGRGAHFKTRDTPEETKVFNNYPNPFNNNTNIRFDLTEKKPVNVSVYNSAGQRVATLVDKRMPAGIHTVKFNGRGLSSGLYIVRLNAPGIRKAIKITLLK